MPPCPPELPSNTPIQLKRSSTLHKRPLPECLREGQPAVNYNSGDPGLYFSDESGSELIKIGPCHVGSTAPNSPATGSTGNSKGEFWLDTTIASYPTLKVWDGSQWIAYGYVSSNTLWVDPSGDDDNPGLTPQAPKKTIKAALDVSLSGYTVRVSSGTYSEDNPLIFPEDDISVVGVDPSTTVIEPQNNDEDLFKVRSGSIIENFSFSGNLDAGKSITSFIELSPTPASISSPPSVSSCRNLIAGSVGIDCDGSSVSGDPTIVAQNFYQKSASGTGFKASAKGFIQASGCQTVFSGTSALAETGGTITLTGCKSSCGNNGLVADGKGPEEQYGELVSINPFGDTLSLENLLETQRPYVGQILSVGQLYYKGKGFDITYQGVGYTSPPSVQVSIGSGPNAISAAGTAVIEDGKVVDIMLTRPGRSYTSTDVVTVTITGGSPTTPATAELELEPIYYSVLESTEITSQSCVITLSENIPYEPPAGSEVRFYRASRIFASSHFMEYVGCGTNSPYSGVPPIKENQVIQQDGGKVFSSSMDETGMFSVGGGFFVNQTTGEVSGEGFSRSVLGLIIPQSVTLK